MKVKSPEKLPLLENEMLLPQKEWAKQIRNEMSNYHAAQSKALNKGKIGSKEQIDLTPAMEKRRTAALLSSLKNLDEKSQQYAIDWITLNVFSGNYTPCIYGNHILTAAAIWILDKLSIAGVPWNKIYTLLPRDDHELDDLFDLDVWDAEYDGALIASVEYVLGNRNQDIAPLEYDNVNGYRLITSDLCAKGKDRGDVPSRKNFEKLIALIPNDVREQAAKHFEDCYKAWTDRFFIGIEYWNEQYLKQREVLNSIRTEINDLTDTLTQKANRISDVRNKARKAKPPLNVLLNNPSNAVPGIPGLISPVKSALPSDNGSSEPELLEFLDKYKELDDVHYQACEEMDKIVLQRKHFVYNISRNGYTASDMLEGYPEKVQKELLKPIPITDPYELCFALLYLVETGSDIPWLYGSCISMLKEVVDYLPWGLAEYDEINDPYWEDDVPTPSKVPDFPDWYERNYSWKGDSEYNARSLSQILYETTGCLMPRDLHRYDAELKSLGKYGIKQNKAIAMLYCMTALSNTRRQVNSNNFNADYMNFLEHGAGAASKPDVEETLTPEDWSAQKAELEEQIQKLRTSLYNAEKSAADARKKLEQQKAASKAEHRELVDLREVIFNRDEEDNDDTDEVVDSSKYPYTIQKSTVVFGGHESWVKSLKPLLMGDIKFIAKEMKIDVSLVRYADVVWIQTNAIPHRSYYSIVNTARKMDKAYKIFYQCKCGKVC